MSFQSFHKVLIIVNPVSGDGKGLQRLEQSKELLRLRGIDCKTVITESGCSLSDFCQLLKSFRDEPACLVIGGDGTVNAAVNCFVGSAIQIGIIPSGTGNSLAKWLGMPFTVEEAVKTFLDGSPYAIDVGKVSFGNNESRYFLLQAGIGLDAEISADVTTENKRKTGWKAYLYPALRKIFQLPPADFEIYYSLTQTSCTRHKGTEELSIVDCRLSIENSNNQQLTTNNILKCTEAQMHKECNAGVQNFEPLPRSNAERCKEQACLFPTCYHAPRGNICANVFHRVFTTQIDSDKTTQQEDLLHSEITTGERIRFKSRTVVVSNFPGYGGGRLSLAPYAKVDDGVLNLCVIKSLSTLSDIEALLDVKLNMHKQSKYLFLKEISSAMVSAKPELKVQVDGEYIGTTPVELSIVSRGVQLITKQLPCNCLAANIKP